MGTVSGKAGTAKASSSFFRGRMKFTVSSKAGTVYGGIKGI